MVAFCSLLHFVMLKYLFYKYSLFFSNFILNFYHKKGFKPHGRELVPLIGGNQVFTGNTMNDP